MTLVLYVHRVTAVVAVLLLLVAAVGPAVGAGATGAVSVAAGVAWRDRRWSLVSRVHYSLVALALAAFAATLVYFDLAGLPV